MVIKLKRQGNSEYLLIPKFLQKLMNLNENKEVLLKIEDNKLVIESIKNDKINQKIEKKQGNF